MKHIVFFFLFIASSLTAQIDLVFQTAENYSYDPAKEYLLADKVVLRAAPEKKAKAITTLPISTDFYILAKSTTTLTIKGITSAWYQIKTKDRKGWIWGGFIARRTFGSNEDPSIKFLTGFSHQEMVKDEEGGEYAKTYMQIRAVKNGQEIDKLVFPLFMSRLYIGIENIGKKGMEGIDDILVLHIPCEGGCGCTTGDELIFWTGKKLFHVLDLIGTADAWASEGASVTYPADMNGEEGYVKFNEDLIDWAYHEKQGNSKIIRRILSTTLLKWTGEKLVKTDQIVSKKVVYYDTEIGKVVDEPN